MKAYPVNGDEDEEHKQRNGEIYRLRYALRNEEIVLGHGYLAVYLSVIVKNAHGASCGCGEIVEQQQSAEQIYRIMRHVAAEKRAEDHVHGQQQKQRRKRAPEYAEGRALVFFNKVSPYKLRKQKTVVSFVRSHKTSVLLVKTKNCVNTHYRAIITQFCL